MLKNIRIILVNTSHPGNIGSTARAMKTMGLGQLYLVQPEQFPHDKAFELSSGAVDILANAVVVDNLDAALAGCTLVIGTSTRERTIAWPQLTPRELPAIVQAEAEKGQVAIVFGREQSGLTNDELHRCQMCVQIPANPTYSSLNLAAAVQIIAYELYTSTLEHQLPSEKRKPRQATSEEFEYFFEHLQEVLKQIDFLKGKPSYKLMARLRRLFHRARPDEREINILRGILTGVQEKI